MIEKILENCITQVLKRQEETESEFAIRPSNIGDCTRKLWYGLNKTTPDKLKDYRSTRDKAKWIKEHRNDGRQILVFTLGDMIEEQLNKLANENVIRQQEEVKLKINGYELVGHIDGIINEDDSLYIIDYKSTNTKNFDYRVKKGQIDEKYKYQANCYMYALNILKFKFVFYDKNDSDMQEINYSFDQNYIESIERRLEIIHSELTPTRNFEITNKTDGWKCGYCEYKFTCYPGLKEEEKIKRKNN